MTTTKKANHQANIVRVTEIKPHTNADTLEIIPIGEYQVVSKKGQFHVGDLAVYIQPDSVVPQTEPFKFIWEQYMCVPEPGVDAEFVVPEKRRRITVRKFRGEWSEGLLLPVKDFGISDKGAYCDYLETYSWKEGDDVSDFLGITHYDPDAGKETTVGENMRAPKARRKYPKSLRGWVTYIWRHVKNLFGQYDAIGGTDAGISLGIPTYDVDAFKNHKGVFQPDDVVFVTEKIHGSNARYVYLDGIMYAGSRTLWKAENSNCIWRKALKQNPWIEEWCKAHPNHVLWGEVTPTQGGYNYGTDKVQFFMFDVYLPDGKWADANSSGELNIGIDKTVPILYYGPYDEEKIKALVDGPSTVEGANHIREGVVIKTAVEKHVHGLGRAQLKIVSNRFLEKDNK